MTDDPRPIPAAADTVLAVMTARRSCRAYRTEAVPRAWLERLVEAARVAPSACNRQPWRFAVVTRPDVKAAIAARGFLPGLAMHWIAAAPALIVMGLCRSWVTHRVAPRLSGVDYAWIDLGIAGEHVVLQATALGLATCWIGWVRPRVLRRLVAWPASVCPAIVFTVGWPECGRAVRPSSRKAPAELTEWIE